MSSKYKFKDQEKLYFITNTVVYWLDVFIRNEYKEIILDSIRYCQREKGLEVYSWCIMTSHIYMIIGTHHKPMEDIMRDYKSYTSNRLKDEIKNHKGESRREWMLWMLERAGKLNSNNNVYQFWDQGNHPIELFNNEIMQQKLDYLHNNPVEAGFVEKPEDWLWSSARDYAGINGLLDIKIIP